jgi:hypothetical protein
MVVYVWTAFLMLFYAANLPLQLVVDADTGRDQPLRVGLGVFVVPRQLKAASRRPGAMRLSQTSRRASLRALFYLLRHIEFRGELALSAGDAALTAILSGAVLALFRGRVRVLPDFSAGRLRARFYGMVSVKPGHIMGAALVWAQIAISGRVQTWKTIRSRAS